MLSESERIELKALQRRAYASNEAALSAADAARLRTLLDASRPARHPEEQTTEARPRAGARSVPQPDADVLRDLGFTSGDSHLPRLSPTAASGDASPGPYEAPPADGQESPATAGVRPRRGLLVAAAVVTALGCVAGGWVLGRATPPAQSSTFDTLVAEARAAQPWDAGSFRVLSYVDDTLNAGGTIRGGREVCMIATGASATGGSCSEATAGTTFPLRGGDRLSTGDGLQVSWNLATTWTGTEFTPGASGLTLNAYTMEGGDSGVYASDAENVSTSAEWSGTPTLLGALGPVRVWGGEVADTDADLCLVVISDAGTQLRCVASTDLPVDITTTVAEVTPDLASLRIAVAATGESAHPYRVDVSPAY